MNRRLLYILSSVFLLWANSSFAREQVQYNFNNYNGLPSAQVYCIISDRNGYLYISTDKGVVQYNGYTFKNFDIVDPDIWKLYEDKKGRVWVFRVAEELGYIKNGKYRRVYFKFPFSMKYPRHVVEHKEGIAFLQFESNKLYFCFEKNDTVYSYNTGISTVEGNVGFMSSQMRIFRIDKRGGYEVVFKNGQSKLRKVLNRDLSARSLIINNLLFLHSSESIHTLDMRNLSEKKVALHRGEKIINAYDEGPAIAVITNKRKIITSDSGTEEMDLSEFMTADQLESKRVIYVHQDSFWHNWVGTASAGVFVNIPAPPFKKITGSIAAYSLLGKDSLQNLYWFNAHTAEFAVVDSSDQIRYFADERIKSAVKIIPYRNGEVIIVTRGGYYTFNIRTWAIKNLFEWQGGFRYYVPFDTTTNKVISGVSGTEPYFREGIDAIYLDDKLYAITLNATYLCYEKKADSLLLTARDYAYVKWRGIIYDSVLNTTILYNGNDLLADKNGLLRNVRGIPTIAGVKKIQHLIVDQKYGNVFVHDDDCLIMYNYRTGQLRKLLKEYKLDNPSIYLADSVLIVANKSGVLVSKIIGPAAVSPAVYYPNVKNFFYRELYSVVSRKNDIVINTDYGLYSIAIPTFDKPTAIFPGSKYRLIARYDDTEKNLNQGDTLSISQSTLGLLFDIIRPLGVGTQKFKVFVPEVFVNWQTLNANEFSLNGLDVDKHYRIKLRVEDDVWKSPVINLVLYIRPGWWQTKTAQGLIWLAAISVLGGIVALAMYYTRKVTLKAQLRKNYLLSLELKSIYAQINPHFIFNTLNTGLYFISENKNDEAYAHISSFSSLLRSYIKSSRNKYVTLAEELENLEYYIRLQQNRFEDKFAYEIAVDSGINPEDVLFPALLLQPFVENAIQHGLLHKKAFGLLTVRISAGAIRNEIVCTIEDDGVGRAESRKIYEAVQSKPTSYGNELIGDLVKIINADNRLKVDINVTDKQHPDTGTIVTITVKQIA